MAIYYLIWYGLLSVVVGAVIATLLPALVLPYAAIAVLGGIFLIRDLSKGKGSGSSSQEDERELTLEGFLRRAEERSVRSDAAVEAARREPWYRDAAVDARGFEQRWLERYPFSGLDDLVFESSPYCVLPLPKLVEWGFATPVEVREAVRWAASPTPPVRWRATKLFEVLTVMGWSEPEACARVGLSYWCDLNWRHTPGSGDSEASASEASARVEASIRAQGGIWDVPRPVSRDGDEAV